MSVYFCMTKHLSMTVFSKIYSQDRRNMLGMIGGPSHSDQIMQFSWKRKTILFSFNKEQTEENANMLFVINSTMNIQKSRRDQEVVFSVKMSWFRLVIMSYTINSYVLMSGGVPEITWEVLSGQNMPWVVLTVRGCLLWGIHNWENFMGLCVCVMCRAAMIWDGGIYMPILIVAQNSSKY